MNSVTIVTATGNTGPIAKRLTHLGVLVNVVGDLQASREVIDGSQPLLVVLLAPPAPLETLEACRHLAAATSTPVLVWGDVLDAEQRITALLLGASEVFPVGLNADEVSTVLYQRIAELGVRANRSTRALSIGALSIDIARRRVQFGDQAVALTKLEFDILTSIARRAGEVVSRKQITTDVWGPTWFGVANLLDTHVAHIRAKLVAAGATRGIVTVRGVGYCIDHDSMALNDQSARLDHPAINFACT